MLEVLRGRRGSSGSPAIIAATTTSPDISTKPRVRAPRQRQRAILERARITNNPRPAAWRTFDREDAARHSSSDMRTSYASAVPRRGGDSDVIEVGGRDSRAPASRKPPPAWRANRCTVAPGSGRGWSGSDHRGQSPHAKDDGVIPCALLAADAGLTASSAAIFRSSRSGVCTRACCDAWTARTAKAMAMSATTTARWRSPRTPDRDSGGSDPLNSEVMKSQASRANTVERVRPGDLISGPRDCSAHCRSASSPGSSSRTTVMTRGRSSHRSATPALGAWEAEAQPVKSTTRVPRRRMAARLSVADQRVNGLVDVKPNIGHGEVAPPHHDGRRTRADRGRGLRDASGHRCR